jgi:hypothetical protein
LYSAAVSNYRDALAAGLAVLDARRSRVSARLAELRPAHRAVMTDHDEALLARASEALGEVASTQDDIDRLNRHFDALEQAIARVEAALSVEDAPPLERDVGEGMDGIGRWLEHLVAAWEGYATQRGQQWLAHARAGEVSVEVEVSITETVERVVTQLRIVTTSSVPRAVGPVMIAPQTGFQTFAKRISLLSEHETGARAVDDAYWIDGDEDALRAILTADSFITSPRWRSTARR